MKAFIVLSCLIGIVLPRASSASLVALPIAYARLEAGAPIGLDGRVVDTPEVAYAKAEHAAAHLNERLRQASSEAVVIEPVHASYSGAAAPTSADGRVVDTPEVAYAKAEHAAAHINEKLRVSSPILAAAVVTPALAPTVVSPLPVITKAQSGAPIGLDGRVVDTPEVAHAKAEHAAAHLNAQFESAVKNLKNYAATSQVYLASPYVQYYY